MIRIYLFSILSGFTALTTEIYGIKVVENFFAHSSYASAIVISSFLAGLALSAYIFSRVFQNVPSLKLLQSTMILYAGYAIFFLLFAQEALTNIQFERGINPYGAKYLILFWFFLFVPALFFGGILPVLARYVEQLSVRRETFSKLIGNFYFFETIGGIMGTFVAGFFLIPEFGLQATLSVIVLTALISVFMLGTRREIFFGIVLLLAATVKFSAVGLATFQEKHSRFGKVLFQKPSPYGLVTVGRSENPMSVNDTLYIDYRQMCHSLENNHMSEKFLGKNLPQGNKELRALNIGLGCGFTAMEILKDPRVTQLDIVEINPVVLEAEQEHFAAYNDHVTRHPRARVILDDGAKFLLNLKTTYDAIIIDIEEPSVVHSSPVFTKEYIELAKNALTPGGLFSIWTFNVSPVFSKVLFNTVHAVFPYTSFRVIGDSIQVIGSVSPHKQNIDSGTEGEAARWASLQIGQEPSLEINTLKHRALEKYFDVRKVFQLP